MGAVMLDVNLMEESLFGNEAAEDEDPERLSDYFISRDTFMPFLTPSNRLRIVRARKGMGKSALLHKFARDLRLRSPNNIVLTLTGADLSALGDFNSMDPARLVNEWQQALCRRISYEVARREDVNIAPIMDDLRISMIESAELAGFKDRNIVKALAERLISKLSIGKLAVNTKKIEPANFSAALQRYVNNQSDFTAWVLVDDIDSTFANTPEFRLRLSTFFSACRKIIREVRGLHVRATVRADVWTTLRDNEDLDKCEQYVTDITWTKEEVAVIVTKQLLTYLRLTFPNNEQVMQWSVKRDRSSILQTVFEPRIRWGNGAVPPEQALNILGGRRPRWAVQLARLAAYEAGIDQSAKRIGFRHIRAAMGEFGRRRLDDLYKEHGHQYSDLRGLMQAFSRGHRSYSTSSLLKRILDNYLTAVVHDGVPHIDGQRVDGPLPLAHFLFRIGVLQGRDDEMEATQWVAYEDRADLLKSKVNLDDGLSWEITTAYRVALGIR